MSLHDQEVAKVKTKKELRAMFTLRVPCSFVSQADRLARKTAQTRSGVLRLALIEGFKILEERYGGAK